MNDDRRDKGRARLADLARNERASRPYALGRPLRPGRRLAAGSQQSAAGGRLALTWRPSGLVAAGSNGSRER